MTRDKSGWDVFFDIVDDIRDIAREHDDEINSLIGRRGRSISLEDSEPLTDITKSDDKISIVLEIKDVGGISDLSFIYQESKNKLKVSGSDSTTVFRLPEDADVDGMSVNFKNGVLTMDIPREGRKIEPEIEDEGEEEDEE